MAKICRQLYCSCGKTLADYLSFLYTKLKSHGKLRLAEYYATAV